MTAADYAPDNGGGLLGMVVVIGLFAAGMVAIAGAAGISAFAPADSQTTNAPVEVSVVSQNPVVNAPPVQPISQHAIETHPEAIDIDARYRKGDYLCLRQYQCSTVNRILMRFTYANQSLEGGIFVTVSGTFLTAFTAPADYWNHVVVRDGYLLWFTTGNCN